MASHSEPNNFDALRICAASAVLYSHHHALTGQFEPSVLGIHTLGGFAVLVFFTISGYLVTNSWLVDPNVFRFSARRALRIWPAYTAVVLISAYLLGTWVSDMSWDQYLKSQETASYLSNIWLVGKGSLLVSSPTTRFPALSMAPWTIPFEIQCYVLLAICGVIGLLKVRALWLFFIAVCVVGTRSALAPIFTQTKLKREMVIYFLVGSPFACSNIDQPTLAHRFGPGHRRGMLWLTGYKYLAFLTAVPYLTIIVGRSSTPVIKHLGHWGDPLTASICLLIPFSRRSSIGCGPNLALCRPCVWLRLPHCWLLTCPGTPSRNMHCG
ncbi:acyltransferase [Ottowia sp.]|uniref:acyltransferase family protein n=1 Tax=Ottowia sp. TaxID=1898956 RepID=UPI0025E23E41|nr:acyltransferase [Ottowia sp.]MBK6744942.1 acyltransferase [Ottowia sp.]